MNLKFTRKTLNFKILKCGNPVSAIGDAADYLNNTSTTNKIATFYTDSLAAIHSLAATTTKAAITLQCHKSLNDLSVNNEVSIASIPGHKGHWGNEEAYTLAKKGTKDGIR